MDRQLGGTLVTKQAGPLRCPTCERIPTPLRDDRYVCPCCGELFVLVEALIGAAGPWGNGLACTGMGTNDAGHTTALPASHVCTQPKRGRRNTQAERLFGVDDGRT